MTIRKAVQNDKERIVGLVKAFDEYFSKNKLFSPEILPFTEYKNKDVLFASVVDEWLNNSDYFVFVAEENEELVGHIVGSIKEKQERKIDKEGSIDEWFVREDKRYQGIGRSLYDALLGVFQEQKCNHIGLKVYIANKDTIALYERIGFLPLELTMLKKLA